MKRILATLVIAGAVVASPLTALAAPVTLSDGTVFDAEYYAQQNPDVVAALGTDAALLYQHYVMYGKNEGRLPYAQAGTASNATGTAMTLPDGTVFDPVYYAQNYPDVVAALGTDANLLAQHYIQYGKAEGRKPSAGNTQTVATSNAGVTTLQGLLDHMHAQTIKPGWKIYADREIDVDYWGKARESHFELASLHYGVALDGWPNGFTFYVICRRSDEKVILVNIDFQKTWLTYSGGHTRWHMDEDNGNGIAFETGSNASINSPETEWTNLSLDDCKQIIDVAMSYYADEINESTFVEFLRSMAIKGGNVKYR